jgi:hypothetical protein
MPAAAHQSIPQRAFLQRIYASGGCARFVAVVRAQTLAPYCPTDVLPDCKDGPHA